MFFGQEYTAKQRAILDGWAKDVDWSCLPDWYKKLQWVDADYNDADFPAKEYGDFGEHELKCGYRKETGDWPPVLSGDMEERRGAACEGGWGTFPKPKARYWEKYHFD